MNIGMVLERDFPTIPPDIRVEKEMRSLLKAGHKVDLLSLKITSTQEEDLFIGRIPIFRAPIRMLRIREWEKESVERHYHSPLSPWVHAVKEFLQLRNIDALHVHDLPLAWTCAYAASGKGVPVVLDMHEVYPDLVRFMRPEGEHGSWDPPRWTASYEEECLRMVDRVIVTVEESRQRLARMGLEQGKTRVVMNTEEIESMKSVGTGCPPLSGLEGKCVVTYVGAFGEVRGLDQLIHAAWRLSAGFPEIHLLLVGGGYNETELRTIVTDLHMGKNVTITGWVPFNHVPDLIDFSDICVVPHLKNPFTDTTVPHKLFQYMLLGKPVIVSDADPLVRIVTECGCGMVFPSGDAERLAGLIERLASNPEERRRLGENGRMAALDRYHWGEDQKELLDVYRELDSNSAPPSCVHRRQGHSGKRYV
jgi:glycosyltransferase involved in cell wall biosynthesis